MDFGKRQIDGWLVFRANTHDPTNNGAASDADAVPSYRIYEEETGAAILTGNMALLDDANTIGFYSERIQLTAASGFEINKDYGIYIQATVNGVIGTMHHSFRITNTLQVLESKIIDFIESQRGAHTFQGNAFYVDPFNGNDVTGDGSRALPYATVTKALTVCTDYGHDVIFLLAGNPAGQTVLDEQVTVNKAYTFIRGPGRDFLWHSTSNGDVITVTSPGVELSGFELTTHTAGVGKGITTTGDYTRIHHLYIHNTRGTAIESTVVNWCFIENNQLFEAGQSGAGHGIDIVNGGGPTEWNVVRDNSIFHTAGDGVRLGNNINVRHNIIHDNIFMDNDGYGVNVRDNARETVIVGNHFAKVGIAAYIDNGTDTHIEHNEEWAKHSIATELRMAELDAANIPTDLANIQAKTDNLPSGIKRNTALNDFEFFMAQLANGYTGITGIAITATRSIDGGAFAACANVASEVGLGVYKINFAASDLNGGVITFKFSGTGARDRIITIVTQA